MQKEKYSKLASDVEKQAEKKLEENPSDVQSYYNPYRILIDVYEGQGRNDKLWRYGKTGVALSARS